MKGHKKKSSTKIQKRKYTVEGTDQKIPVLADKVTHQVLAASTPSSITVTNNNLPQVPKLGNFPDMEFLWCNSPTTSEGTADDLGAIVQMMKILHNEDIELHIEAVLQIYLNIVVLIYPQAKDELNRILREYGFETRQEDWETIKSDLNISEEDVELESEDTPKITIIMAIAGIYLCLIGKQLNSQNYTNWIKSRIRSFASSCAIEANNNLMQELVPATTHSVSVYTSISSRWEIRRHIFLYIRASSGASGIQASMARCCMVLLNGAELGNFSLTNKYIIIQNPILLCWQELAKHSPVLIAAVDKYQSLGEDGPYCKLLYPSQDLQEFTQHSLKIFAAIARRIAIQEGLDSLKNYAGADAGTGISVLVSKAMYLVKVAGGANTFTTEGMRRSFLVNCESNVDLVKDLGLGAHVDGKEEGSNSSSSEEEENIAI